MVGPKRLVLVCSSMVAGSKANGVGSVIPKAPEDDVDPVVEPLVVGLGSGAPALSIIPSWLSSTPLGVDWALKSRLGTERAAVVVAVDVLGPYNMPLSMPVKLRLSRMLRYSAPTIAFTLSHLRSRNGVK